MATPQLKLETKENDNVVFIPRKKARTMTQKTGAWFQQHAVTIILAVITFITTFLYMQFKVEALIKENVAIIEKTKEDKAALMAIITENKSELKKEVADAQAYGVAAGNNVKFMQGLLIGKGIAKPEDFLLNR